MPLGRSGLYLPDHVCEHALFVNVQGAEGHGVGHSPGRTEHGNDAEPGVCRQSKPSVPLFNDFKCCIDVRLP